MFAAMRLVWSCPICGVLCIKHKCQQQANRFFPGKYICELNAGVISRPCRHRQPRCKSGCYRIFSVRYLVLVHLFFLWREYRSFAGNIKISTRCSMRGKVFVGVYFEKYTFNFAPRGNPPSQVPRTHHHDSWTFEPPAVLRYPPPPTSARRCVFVLFPTVFRTAKCPYRRPSAGS